MPTRDEMAGSIRREAERMLCELVGSDARFRDGQWEAILSLILRRRALVVQRTGWGKSAVYLIATRLLRKSGVGPTVIVSPLVALMRNQVAMAARAGLNAVTINSANTADWHSIEASIRLGAVDLLLISPERLANERFRREVLPDLLASMGMLVVDEAHCISEWGHDFRPDYRRLARLVASLPPTVPILATTATANDRVVHDVAAQLGPNLDVHRGPLDRESLALQVIPMADRADRMAWLAQVVPHLSGAGIVYCLTVRDVERVARWLAQKGVNARAYSGEVNDEQRVAIELELEAGGLKVVVATSALGMGYDNPLIEFVVHYQSPGSPIAYYQQVGRAGRAVASSLGVLLAGEEDADIQDYFIRNAFPTASEVGALLEALVECPRSTSSLDAVVNLQRGRIAATLRILEVEGAIYREDRTWYRSANPFTYPAERVRSVTQARRREQEQMRSYLRSKECLMMSLRRALDDHTARPCGRCSVCMSAPIVDPAVDSTLRQEALRFLNRSWIPILPRVVAPSAVDLPDLRALGNAEGRSLTKWGDPGLAQAVARGKYIEGHFSDELVEAVCDMVADWMPDPELRWVTCVPGNGSSQLVSDFARRVADSLGLPFRPVVQRVAERPPQKRMQNSHQQASNQLGAFGVGDCLTTPVLLVDDMVDSRWTFTVVGWLLRKRGVKAVYPLALSDTSRGDT